MTPIVVDAVILAFVALMALGGVRVGCLRAVVGGACALVTVGAVLLGYGPLVAIIARAGWLGGRAATLAAFAILGACGQALVYAIQRPLGAGIASLRRSAVARRLDHVAGAAPGAVAGLLAIGLILAPLAVAAPESGLGPAMQGSRLAPGLLDADARLLQATRVRPLLQPAAEALAIPSPLSAYEEGRELPFRIGAAELALDAALEARMLALVNGERARAGLPALAFDEALAAVARAHATEMFALGYFAHDSPVAGDPFDRLDAAGVAYVAAGENLAFAPDLGVAHRGLMNSPRHRANILSPDFGRAGIGIVRSRYHGLMIVQLFRD